MLAWPKKLKVTNSLWPGGSTPHSGRTSKTWRDGRRDRGAECGNACRRAAVAWSKLQSSLQGPVPQTQPESPDSHPVTVPLTSGGTTGKIFSHHHLLMSIHYIKANWNVSRQQEILSAAQLAFRNTSHCLQKNRRLGGGSPWSWGKDSSPAHLTSEAFPSLSDLHAALSSCYSKSSYKNFLSTSW